MCLWSLALGGLRYLKKFGVSERCELCKSELTNHEGIDPNDLQFCKECENYNALTMRGEEPEHNGSKRMDRSCILTSGDFQVGANTQREGVDAPGSGQSHPSSTFTQHSEELGNGSSSNCPNSGYSNANAMSFTKENQENSSNEKGEDDKNREGDTLHLRIGVDSNSIDNCRMSFLSDTKLDPDVWNPPGPKDFDHNMDSGDDNDNYPDRTKLDQPNCLSSIIVEKGNHHNHQEERRKAMMAELNGEFKILVSQILASVDIGLPPRENAKNWLHIVTSLSWEAAMLIKPNADEGTAMDPLSYVKVKCIASGARNQSEVIRGLVFKKNAVHKHMAAKLMNPSILLFQGSLVHSETELSSFKYVEEEDDYKKSIIEMIGTCQPNVVLVEKTVSRDIQECLLEKGITLVSDMKLPRLERVARCTGSQIVSSANVLIGRKLQQCSSFHIEKFVEEHNSYGEGEKKPTKTLMFLEGCPKPLGCTILLKGAHSDELKKVKHATQLAVFAVYHKILETSFFADQGTVFTDLNVAHEVKSTSNESMPSVRYGVSSSTNDCSLKGCIPGIAQTCALDNPISDGLRDDGKWNLNSTEPSMLPKSHTSATNNAVHNGNISNSLRRWRLVSDVSASLKKLSKSNLPDLIANPILSYFGSNDGCHNTSALVSPHACNRREGANGKTNQEEPNDGICNCEMAALMFDRSGITENGRDKITDEIQIDSKIDNEITLNTQNLLVLRSSHCVPKDMVCEQSRLSRVKYYGNFDTSLGHYLRHILLNQKHICSACGEPPEAHVYHYTHQNGKITILVRRLPKDLILPGESKGKIWMWTRCLKCQHESGIARPTRRVVMSSDARRLSFGKFLELSFSSHYAVNRLSKCGHQLHRHCLHFFGLGSTVAMFRYTSIDIYTACKPPPVLELCTPSGQEWFAREARDVCNLKELLILGKADLLFTEVDNILKKLKPNLSSYFSEQSLKNSGSIEKLEEVEEMLIVDKTELVASFLKATDHLVQPQKEEYWILDFNWLIQELLLLLYVWDRRLHFIFSCPNTSNCATGNEQFYEENDVIYCDNNAEGNILVKNIVLEGPVQNSFVDVMDLSPTRRLRGQNCAIMGTRRHLTESAEASDQVKIEFFENSSESVTEDSSTGEKFPSKICREKCAPVVNDIQEDDNTIPVLVQLSKTAGRVTDFEHRTDRSSSEMEVLASCKSQDPKLEDPERWIWDTFSELRRTFKMDLYGGFLQKFEFVNTYTPSYLSPMHKPVDQVMSSLHFSVGPNGNVISVIEDEISSIIACSLALFEDEKITEKQGKGDTEETTIYNTHSMTTNGSMASSQRPLTGLLESDRIRSLPIFSSSSSYELVPLGSDLSFFKDRTVRKETMHPKVSFGLDKVSGKCKYIVVCIYGEQFYSLRMRCFSSEMAFISSLSRCKKWDAQGGKSKALFAKTMDDRFILKQIKKPELDSFLKFGPDYFRYVIDSLDSGSQTCLAKILGVYEVRQYKNGKEVKIDLVVMENIFYGKDISLKYDLKGAVFSRYVPKSNDPDSVFLDENFVEHMRVSPIYLGGKTKHLLQRAIWNDTVFLTSNNVMDYSLLVGVDMRKHELVIGIIDYLRQYTFDKQLETWMKASLCVPKNELPTVVSPKEYRKRFREFMTKYFLTVPDT